MISSSLNRPTLIPFGPTLDYLLGETGNAALIGPPWSIVGTCDFNLNGTADILWHNSSTGETQIWFMDVYKVASRATVLGETGNATLIGPRWIIVGT